jgi:hypothetical protein
MVHFVWVFASQRLYVIITQFNKSSIFCNEYLLFVVEIHAQAAN